MSNPTEKEMAQEVLEALLALKEDGPICGQVGICTAVMDIVDDAHGYTKLDIYWDDSRVAAFENWDDPSASGCGTFPIKGNYMSTPREMWIEGEYAAARWRLVDHLIKHYTSLAEEE